MVSRDGGVSLINNRLPLLVVTVGLPASGKTTRAKKLEVELPALRLTPDEWMIPLFCDPEADGRRDVLEGRFVSLAMSALRVGISVILDFGVWSKDERTALRFLAGEQGAQSELVYLPVDHSQQLRRVKERLKADPEMAFEIIEKDLVTFREFFQEPDFVELNTSDIDEPPVGYSTWNEWCASRWPTSML
jgi:predicted kinase